MSLIIIEGIDRVGKTTLCNILKEELPTYNLVVDTWLNKDNFCKVVNAEKINTITNFVAQTNANVISDRLHMTEFVYGMIDRGYVNYDMIELDNKLSKMDTLLVLVKPTDVKRSSREHGADLSEHDKMFNDFYKSSHIKDKIECTYSTMGQAIDKIKGWANKNENL